MGKETISSQELSDYTHVNSTQIRRDLSGFGKFGKRGVGYNVDSLVSQIRKILRTAGQHNIALFGAGHLGRAIASSDIFADHGFRVVAIFDADPAKVGEQVGAARRCATSTSCARSSRRRTSSSACSPCPTAAAQALADELVDAGVKIIFNYSEALLEVPPGGDRPHLQPGRRPALRAVLLPDLSRSTSLDLDRAAEVFAASTDGTVGLEEEFAILDPRDARPASRASRSCATPRARDPVLAESIAGELISSRDRDPLRPRRGPRTTRSRASATTAGACSRSPPSTASRSARPARTRGPTTASSAIIDTEHYRRVEDGLKYVAWRNNTFSLHVHVGVQRRRPRRAASATACARCCRCCWRSRPTRRSSTGATRGLHSARTQTLHEVASRAAACRTRSAAGGRSATTSTSSCAPTRSSSTRRCGGRSARTCRFGTVEVRICDAQTTAAESEALAALIVACVRAGRARRRRGRAVRSTRRRG